MPLFVKDDSVSGSNGVRKVRIVALIATGLLLVALNLSAASVLTRYENLSYERPWMSVTTNPLSISGDDWFTDPDLGYSGTGTVDDPYVIELRGVWGFDIYGNDWHTMTAFDISNTKAHLQITRCTATYMECAVRLTNVTNCSIIEVDISGGSRGIIMDNCSSCAIVGCKIQGEDCGQLNDCTDVVIRGNEMYGQSSQLELVNCEQIKIYHNDFLRYYGVNVTDVGGFDNKWDNGYPSGGNYWEGYEVDDHRAGSKQNLPWGDGIGDSAYVGNVTDRYPLVRQYFYKDFYETKHETAQLFPEALLGNIVLVPLFVALFPDLKLKRGWIVGSLFFAVLAAVFSWPSLINASMDIIPYVVSYRYFTLAHLDIIILGFMVASMALFVKARDWSVKLNLQEFLLIGFVGALISLYVSIRSGVWHDLPWMSSMGVFIVHTFLLFIGASAFGWYICARRRLANMNLLKDAVEVDCRILLLIYAITSFGLVASVFGYGLFTPLSSDLVREGSQSILVNALPGSAGMAFLFVSLRTLRWTPRQRLPIILAIVFVVILAFFWEAITKYLAWRYGT